jgi:hypothetical protein
MQIRVTIDTDKLAPPEYFTMEIPEEVHKFLGPKGLYKMVGGFLEELFSRIQENYKES